MLYEQSGTALTLLRRSLEAELEHELSHAAAIITSVANRLYAYGLATNSNSTNHAIMNTKIPSLTADKNLFQAPVHYNPHDYHITRSYWESDRKATALCKRLKGFGMAVSAIRRDERKLDECELKVHRMEDERCRAESR